MTTEPQWNIIGKPVAQVGSRQKVTGEALYTDDFRLPGLLVGKILRSPHAAARIVRLDTREAEAMPGVHAVVTGRDAPRPFVFTASCGPAGEPWRAEPGSLEHFLAERYCLYASDGPSLHRAEIHHPLWPLQEAEATVEENTMPPPDLSLGPSGLSRFSRRQDVLVWPLRPVDQAVAIRQALELRPSFALDLLVRTPAYIEDRLAEGDLFLEDVINEGMTLYEAGDAGLDRQGLG